ncbi:uncharacterized protein LOC142181555 [Nicotiana tabacum]|uniref:Uncharacterized protein LOC142181555 n=1 Tax=Nicotiana tabacum TaxID=4097 RepID=A0AC58UM60_TOBAC
MKLLAYKKKLSNLKHVELGLCEDCIYGKQKRVSFSKLGRTPKKEKLELVHTDVWGPAPVTSLGGSHYYVTFIDNFTRKVWVYFLKNKSDVFITFKRWKAEVENQTSLKLKCLKSDNVGEYDNQEFKAFCSENGIRMIKTVPGTPEQNGVAERMNKTLNERARSMRIHSGLPKYFWAEAVNTAAYLRNRGPSVPLNFEIPKEDKLEVEPTNTSKQTMSEIVELEEISENEVARGITTDSEIKDEEPEAEFEEELEVEPEAEPEIESNPEPNLESGPESNSDSVTHEPTLRRSKKVMNAPDRLVLSIVAAKNLHLEQLDVKTAFMHGDLEEDIYMKQPEGFQVPGGNLDSRKSTTGYVFTLGGTAVSWMSRLQKSVALSTTEADDSQSAIHLAKNPVFHARSKHIQLRYHHIRELINEGTLSLQKIPGSKKPSDMLTKVVVVDKLRLCTASVSLQD